jgi:hypothetical protein
MDDLKENARFVGDLWEYSNGPAQFIKDSEFKPVECCFTCKHATVFIGEYFISHCKKRMDAKGVPMNQCSVPPFTVCKFYEPLIKDIQR